MFRSQICQGIVFDNRVIQAKIGLLFFACIIYFLFYNKIDFPLVIAIPLYILIMFFAFHSISTFRKNQRVNFSDMGLLLLIVMSYDVVAISLSFLFSDNVVSRIYPISKNSELLVRTVLLFGMFMIAISLIYSLRSFHRDASVSHNSILLRTEIIYFAILIMIAVSFLKYVVLDIPISIRGSEHGSAAYRLFYDSQFGTLLQQLLGKTTILVTIAQICAVGVFVSKAKHVRSARYRLLFIVLIIFVIEYALTTDRASGLVIGSGGAAYSELFRWRGRLITKSVFILCCIGLIMMSIGTGIIDLLQYRGFQIAELNKTIDRYVMFHEFPFEVASTVVDWVDTGKVTQQFGSTYFDALRSILPSQFYDEPVISSSNWFIQIFRPHSAAEGKAMGFSPVAEGYLNWKLLGVALEGVILGILLLFIKYFSYIKEIGIILYSVNVSWWLGLYRFDVTYAVEHLFWYSVIGVLYFLMLKAIIQFPEWIKAWNSRQKSPSTT